MTGLDERAHLMNRAIDFDTHVQDIVGVIRREELSDVVLGGHPNRGETGLLFPRTMLTRGPKLRN
ncbi:hypothetical protein [Bradyrhizobium sp. Ash2021]|uniref:hypothetical protein n=1 Tax=Bradyrhizobium sp. Ash2021 TaxID=2954771 RepID=UPI002814A0B4|nr:hypothetical protein [Bradyrhizobium sp. Ash2021]